MKYFTMQECTYSSTAVAKGIDNTPTPEIEAHIVESVETLLDPLREAWETHCKQNGLGKVGINISSGYRCLELNKAVGGSSTSAHRYGYAFDLVPTNGQMRAFKRFKTTAACPAGCTWATSIPMASGSAGNTSR